MFFYSIKEILTVTWEKFLVSFQIDGSHLVFSLVVADLVTSSSVMEMDYIVLDLPDQFRLRPDRCDDVGHPQFAGSVLAEEVALYKVVFLQVCPAIASLLNMRSESWCGFGISDGALVPVGNGFATKVDNNNSMITSLISTSARSAFESPRSSLC
jgi:hypothetical protein